MAVLRTRLVVVLVATLLVLAVQGATSSFAAGPGADVAVDHVVHGEGSTVAGVLTEADGTPVHAGGVVLYDRRSDGTASPRLWIELESSPDGAYAFRELPAGTYLLSFVGELSDDTRARVGGLDDQDRPLPGTRSVVVPEDATVRVDQVLDHRGTVYGRIADRRPDTPVEAVVQRLVDGRWTDEGPVEMDRRGRYDSALLPAGTYRLSVRTAGRFPLLTDAVEVDPMRGTRLDGALAGRSIVGRVRPRPGQPLLVQVLRRDGSVAGATTVTEDHQLVDLGPFAAGTYTLRYRDPAGTEIDLYGAGSPTPRAGRGWFELDRDLLLRDPELAQGRILEGMVRPARAGGPTPRVQVMQRSGRGGRPRVRPARTRTATGSPPGCDPVSTTACATTTSTTTGSVRAPTGVGSSGGATSTTPRPW